MGLKKIQRKQAQNDAIALAVHYTVVSAIIATVIAIRNNRKGA